MAPRKQVTLAPPKAKRTPAKKRAEVKKGTPRMRRNRAGGSAVELQGVVNFRDSGGYHLPRRGSKKTGKGASYDRTKNVAVMERGLLYRGASIGGATAGDQEMICDVLSVRTLIDLRAPFEAAAERGTGALERRFADDTADDGRRLERVPLLNRELVRRGIYERAPAGVKLRMLMWTLLCWRRQGMKSMMRQLHTRGDLKELYRMYLEFSGEEIRRVLELLSNRVNLPAMVFCSAGKDRTGLVIALVQACCGVAIEDIASDYHLSAPLVAPIRDEDAAALSRYGVDGSAFMGAPAEAIVSTLEWIDEKFGSVQDYLTSIGFGPEKQERLHESLAGEVEEMKSVSYKDGMDSDAE